jgi:hypothetical protein
MTMRRSGLGINGRIKDRAPAGHEQQMVFPVVHPGQMDGIRFEGRSDLEEVRRRIHLSGLVSASRSATATQLSNEDNVEYLIDLSPFEAELAEQIEALFPDLPVFVIAQGIVASPIKDGAGARFPRWQPPSWSGPNHAMVQALLLVQADLDAAGLAEHVMSYAVAGGTEEHPVVNVGSRGTWTEDGLLFGSDALVEVIVDVASEAARGLVQRDGLYWPTCPLHGGRTRATASLEQTAVWMCEQRDAPSHVLATIGKLQELGAVGGSTPLWRTLDQMPRS